MINIVMVIITDGVDKWHTGLRTDLQPNPC